MFVCWCSPVSPCYSRCWAIFSNDGRQDLWCVEILWLQRAHSRTQTHTHTPCIQSPVNNPIHFSCNCLLTLCHFPGNQSGRSSCDPFRNGIIVTRTTIYRFQQVNVEFFEMNIPMKYTAEKLKIYSSKLRTMLQNCGRSSNCKMPNGTVHITAEK